MRRQVTGLGMLYPSRSRSTAHPSWQRRRCTKSAAKVDGEYDPDLALAIQESLKQAEIDALKARERQNESVAKIQNNCLKENPGKANRNASTVVEPSSETNQLKDLVCAHMDLIQQQQDVLNQKDRTIKSLRTENNALQCRLQRMERRMALLKQKEDMSGSPHIVNSPPPKPGTMSFTEPLVMPMEKTVHKKKSDLSSVSKRTPVADLTRPVLHKSYHACVDISKTKNRDSDRKRKLGSSATTTSEGDNNTLETNNAYFVTYYEPLAEEVDTDLGKDLISGANAQKEVEVPTFRIKTYTNLYVIEGTEDHEDETFMQRHHKPELEEKRRKRWDDQRHREEMMYARLRERQEQRNKKAKLEDPVEAFTPCLDDISHIEVLDKIPVTAFGQPIPFAKEESFSLPWTPKPSSSTRLRQK
ncbi:male-specific lethal 1-like 1 [Mya arenaria]|nr:male-specific lethal 1-like 1 [Mya arenaria]